MRQVLDIGTPEALKASVGKDRVQIHAAADSAAIAAPAGTFGVAAAPQFTAIFSAASIVRDREFGVLRGILVASVSRAPIVIGKCLRAAFQRHLAPGITWGGWLVPQRLSLSMVALMGPSMMGMAIATSAKLNKPGETAQERRGKRMSDAGWLRGQTTRRRIHRRSDGGPERRQRCPGGGPEHR